MNLKKNYRKHTFNKRTKTTMVKTKKKKCFSMFCRIGEDVASKKLTKQTEPYKKKSGKRERKEKSWIISWRRHRHYHCHHQHHDCMFVWKCWNNIQNNHRHRLCNIKFKPKLIYIQLIIKMIMTEYPIKSDNYVYQMIESSFFNIYHPIINSNKTN